jgi:hypothetical protein
MCDTQLPAFQLGANRKALLVGCAGIGSDSKLCEEKANRRQSTVQVEKAARRSMGYIETSKRP